MVILEFLQTLLRNNPEIALFLAIAIGYWIGKFRFGSLQIGGVAGSLLAAVLISQIGIHIDSGLKTVLFALFIYAVGFQSGPQFFKSLGRQSLREVLMAFVLAISGLFTVLAVARMFHLDKGLAAGIAAGGLTQSAIIGTASSALEKLGLPLAQTQMLQGHVAVGYAVTYIFGSLAPIIICVNILPWLMKRGLREDALTAEAEQMQGMAVYGDGERPALSEFVSRVYQVKKAGQSIQQIESDHVTVEQIRRQKNLVAVTQDSTVEAGDLLLLFGHRADVISTGELLGEEIKQPPHDMDVVIVRHDVLLTNKAFVGKSVAECSQILSQVARHGVYFLGLKRGDKTLPLTSDLHILSGDIVTLYGTRQDVDRVAKELGSLLTRSLKTDLVFHGVGLVVGLLIGLIVVRLGSIPLTLGSGGGALLSGLLFGWYQNRHSKSGNMPMAASTLLVDFGLSGFVAVTGLQTGQQAVTTIMQQGITLFMLGVVVSIVPLIITMLFGRYVLQYKNTAVFAGALAGSRSANPALGEILNKAGNAVPTTSFAITYAIANVLLTLLGPLVVAFS